MESETERKPRSLVDLCVQKAIDNLRDMGHVNGVPRDMGQVDGVATELLMRILPHCTLQQLTKIENRTQTDLTEITDPLWRRFYQKEFGEDHTNQVIKRMKAAKEPVPYTWRQLFEVKTEKQKEVEDMMLEKITKRFQAEKAGLPGYSYEFQHTKETTHCSAHDTSRTISYHVLRQKDRFIGFALFPAPSSCFILFFFPCHAEGHL